MTPLELPAVSPGFGFTEEHELARRAARRFLAERCPIAEIRKLGADDPAWHREIGALGWIGLCASPDHGGAGLDPLHLGLLLDEMGRVLWPTPFLTSVLALGLLEQAGSREQQERTCPAIVRGELVATVALEGGLQAEPTEGGYRLTGSQAHVIAGSSAGLAIVACRQPDDSRALFALELPRTRVSVEPHATLDTTRRTARLLLDGVLVPRGARLEAGDEALLESTRLRGAALLACEMIGAGEAVLEKTRLYAIERQQFGRAIGAFQAVKHPIVNVMIGVELGRSLALGAASLLGSGREEIPARRAKAYAGDLLSEAVQKGVQLHGGFGFTWDCDVHFYFKRALCSRATFGDGVLHRRRLAEKLIVSETGAR
jgi:alkylation response protein AidB-like acyl-CoA dehydrogenase